MSGLDTSSEAAKSDLTKPITGAREIKFRIWFEVEQNMDYDPSTDDSLLNANFTPHFGEVYMQYTGLKDKNGVDIYEGDIYETLPASPDRFKVVYRAGSFCGSRGQGDGYLPLGWDGEVDDTQWVGENVIVIGNIYENPELLAPQK